MSECTTPAIALRPTEDPAPIRAQDFHRALAQIASTSMEISEASTTSAANHRMHCSPVIAASPPAVLTADGSLSEAQAIAELAAAHARLQRDPTILSGDPEGLFNYDDPVLSAALAFAQQAARATMDIHDAVIAGDDLRDDALARWAIVGVQAFLKRHDPSLRDLAAFVPKAPMSLAIEKDVVRIAILGDAGYRGEAQRRVLQSIENLHRQPEKRFDAVIHLGDVYFAADRGAMFEHLLYPLDPLRKQGARLFTLCGNHDIYFGGDPYRETCKMIDQPGRYFLLQTKHWRIACLDTSLAAPGIRRNLGKLDDEQLEWLDQILAANDPRPLILMSHHFIVSAWEEISEPLKQQLEHRISGKVKAWYWGHEHRAAQYGKSPLGFCGACVGNGAFIEMYDDPTRDGWFPLHWYAQSRCDCFDQKDKYWPHGFLELELRPTEIRERFVLEAEESPVRVIDAGDVASDTKHSREAAAQP